jgi:hypothetical protein
MFLQLTDKQGNRLRFNTDDISYIGENGGKVEILRKSMYSAFCSAIQVQESIEDIDLQLGSSITPRAETLAKGVR